MTIGNIGIGNTCKLATFSYIYYITPPPKSQPQNREFKNNFPVSPQGNAFQRKGNNIWLL